MTPHLGAGAWVGAGVGVRVAPREQPIMMRGRRGIKKKEGGRKLNIIESATPDAIFTP